MKIATEVAWQDRRFTLPIDASGDNGLGSTRFSPPKVWEMMRSRPWATSPRSRIE
jgi:hypothetical protein